jgi:hypothetical protein
MLAHDIPPPPMIVLATLTAVPVPLLTVLLPPVTFTVPLTVELELPGRTELVTSTSMIEVDCGVAPAVPLRGCSSVPVLSIGVLALWLARRRAQR